MEALALGARLGTTLTIDLCPACRAIWFDRYEDLQLSPAATLKVFAMIGAQSPAAANPWPGSMACPRCAVPLIDTHDIQRSTRFQYWRCDTHGRLMSFLDFLRAKNFVKPLSPEQIAELRQNVQTINCSNCGGTLDLGKDTVCAHCGSAISMLDLQQMARTIGQLQDAAAGRPAPTSGAGSETVDAAPPAHGSQATDIDALVAAIRLRGGDERPGLIEAGFSLLGDLLRMKL
jgi:hypothetical protein